MSRAVRLLLPWAFRPAADGGMGLVVVHWRAHVGNWASRRVAWACGFRMEGTVRGLCAQRGLQHDAWIGSIGLMKLDGPTPDREIGYWAHPDARGRGVVTRAMREVVRYCFEDLGVRRVTAAAAVENAASVHVIESSGLRRWGTERLGTEIHGGRADLAWFDLLIEEWRSSRPRT
jgi:RimJ/RimL family protein N-acetyltransferase